MNNNYEKQFSEYKTMLETALTEYINYASCKQQEVIDAMRYSLLGGGKRIRGILVLEFARICGMSPKYALPFAAALEMVHASSLIHDDLPCMDDDDMRRGKPSCHIKFGEATALLAGDALFIHGYDTITKHADQTKIKPENIIKAVNILASASGAIGMIGGQIIDLASENKSISADELIHMHNLKTGAIIKAASKIGAVIAGANDEKITSAERFSEKIGLSFQVVDDILDYIGDEQTLGKPIHSDIENQKTTFVSLYGIDKSKEIVKNLTREAKDELLNFEDNGFLLWFTDYLSNRNF